jgi:urease accessory protein
MRTRWQWRIGRTAALVCMMLAAGGAQAHSGGRGSGDFYAGTLNALGALEHVLGFITLGLLAGQQGPKAQAMLPAFLLALLAGAVAALWLPPVPYLGLANVFSAVVMGALVAAAWPLPRALLAGLAVAFGLGHGLGSVVAMPADVRAYLYIPGVGLAGLMVTACGLIAADWLLHRRAGWLHIALRVAGSWIAAIGILALAISIAALSRS